MDNTQKIIDIFLSKTRTTLNGNAVLKGYISSEHTSGMVDATYYSGGYTTTINQSNISSYRCVKNL